VDEFLEDEEVVALGNLCSAAMFPYVEYGGCGISAAMRLLLNCKRLPIYCTPTTHFSDIRNDAEFFYLVNWKEDVQQMLCQDPLLHPMDESIRPRFLQKNSFKQVAKTHHDLYSHAPYTR
jgi:hypothetical protein